MRPILGLTAHRIRMLTLVGVLFGALGAYGLSIGLNYLGLIGSDVRTVAHLPTSGDSLGPSSFVKYHGLVVGHVVQVTGGEVESEATIVIDEKHYRQIPANVKARALPATLFGSEYVDLVPDGPPSAQDISTATSIPADRSAQTVRLMDAIAATVRILEAADPSRLDAALSGIARALDGNGARMGRFLERANRYIGNLVEHQDAFHRDLRLLGEVLDTGADVTPQLLSAMRNSHGTLALVVEQRRALAHLMTTSTGAVDETTRFLTRNGETIIDLVGAGRPVVAIYNRKVGDLATLLRTVPKVLSNGAAGVTDGKITMEGLLKVSDDFGHPYTSADCIRYDGAVAGNCSSGAYYASPYRRTP